MRGKAKTLAVLLLVFEVALLAPSARDLMRFVRNLVDPAPTDESVRHKFLRRIPEAPAERVPTVEVRKAPVQQVTPDPRGEAPSTPMHLAHVGGSWITDVAVRTEATKPSYLKFFLPLTPQNRRAPPA